jgi:hypothetical protein
MAMGVDEGGQDHMFFAPAKLSHPKILNFEM